MKQRFYNHLLYFEDIIAVVGDQKEALEIVEDTIHTHILDEILTHLPKHHHETFLIHLKKSPDDKNLLEFLKKEAREDIENVIEARAAQVKSEVLAEIKKVKK